MSSPQLRLVGGAAAIFLCAFVFSSRVGSQEPEGNYGVGIPDVFMPKYLAYRTAQLADPNPHVMRVRLGYVKGLSTNFTKMTGEMAVNLQTGAYTTTLSGLTPLTTYAVWLVDRSESDLIPPTPDTVFSLITFTAVGPTALLSGILPLSLPFGLTIDRVVVTPGTLWGGQQLAAGTVNVFQKIFFRRLSLENAGTGTVLFTETTPPPSLFARVPDLAAETDDLPPFAAVIKTSPPMLALANFFSPPLSAAGGSVKLDKLISQGADLFFNETFEGNGRTCGTCHPSDNNFTIDPPFIATRPANDPLFVAEFNPVLAGLERPLLMRSHGLILENVDGLENPTVKFVMRGVPHTLGMQVSLTKDTTQIPTPAEMTGWSGDGAPGTGSLREFAIGAVTQHFTKRLNRVAGTDFTLPTEHELDAMEAFQLSLGREKDFDLSKIVFQPTIIDLNAGEDLFVNGDTDPDPATDGTCNFCHNNGGALAQAPPGVNRNFNTNVEDRLHPARTQVEDFPKDGGFGKNPANGAFGNGMFNTAPVVEAADTAPFFHNNVEGIVVNNNITQALEDAVRFYSGPDSEFNQARTTGKFNFNDTEIDQIVAFLQGLNTIQNIDVARRELAEILAKTRDPRQEQDTRLQTAFDETNDAIEVLTGSGLYPTTAKPRLIEARNFISQAQVTTDPGPRRTLIQQAIAKLDAAKSAVATITP
jgi:cytochrome c peroxidase